MNLHSIFENRRDYIYIRMWGKFDSFIFNQAIIETAFRAVFDQSNGVLIDITHVWGFGLKALEALERAESLCCMLPEHLKYAFLARSYQTKEGEFIQAVFGHRGLEVRLISHLREAVDWLRGTQIFIPPSTQTTAAERPSEKSFYGKTKGSFRQGICQCNNRQQGSDIKKQAS